MTGIALALLVGGLAAFAMSACISQDEAKKLVEGFEASHPSRPDGLPVMLNREMPVRYPPSLYASHAQGNVTLRIFLDSTGRVHPESTQVIQSSGQPAFDSAAVTGVRAAQFSPATRHGTPVAVTILFPVYFRHPLGPPVPGDTALHLGGGGGTESPGQSTHAGGARPAPADSTHAGKAVK